MKRDFQLGRYEDVRGPTATGRYRVYWSVKPKYRIDGWPEPVNLTSEPGQGYLDDPVEVQRIVDRMAELNDEFDDRRRQASVQKAEPPRTFARIAKLWTESAFFQTVSKGRQAQYKGVVKAVTKAFPADLMADLTTSQLTRFVESQKEGRRRKFKNDLCQLYELAIGERWTQINPAKKIKYAGQGQRRNVDLWSEDDRDRFVAEARDKGLHGLAGIVQLGWLTGHRRGDLLGARRFIHYAYPNFNYKTQNSVAANQPRWVNVRLPNWMADVIDASRSTRHDFLFENSLTGRPYTVAQFEDHFNYIRGRVQPEGDKHLQFKNLRKSLVVRLAESDVSLLGICAVTGHSPVSAAQIMRYYYIPTDEASHAAIQKDHQRRGGGGNPNDYDVDPERVEKFMDGPPNKVFMLSPAGQEGRDALQRAVSELEDDRATEAPVKKERHRRSPGHGRQFAASPTATANTGLRSPKLVRDSPVATSDSKPKNKLHRRRRSHSKSVLVNAAQPAPWFIAEELKRLRKEGGEEASGSEMAEGTLGFKSDD